MYTELRKGGYLVQCFSALNCSNSSFIKSKASGIPSKRKICRDGNKLHAIYPFAATTQREMVSLSHLSGLVHFVVRQLDFLKGDDLLPQLLARVGSVRVRVESVRRGWVGLARHQPRGSVVGIAVPLVVAGHDVEEDPVLSVRPQIGKAASDSGKHPPEKECREKPPVNCCAVLTERCRSHSPTSPIKLGNCCS